MTERDFIAGLLAALGGFLLAYLALRRRVKAFHQALAAMSDGVLVVRSDGRIESLNEAALVLLGGGRNAWVGRPIWDAFSRGPELADGVRQGRSVRDVETLVTGLRLRTNALVSASPLTPGDSGGGAVLTIKDMTIRRRLERLENDRERERMQRDFVATVSHEFRTPIAAIRGFSETLLAGGLEDSGRRKEFVKIISHHALRLSRLVEDILDLSVLETPEGRADKRERIELASFCDHVARSVLPLAKKAKVTIETHADFRLSVEADPGRLEQVLLNLVKNAVEYNVKGGKVVVTAERDGVWAHLSVRDTGIGVPPEELERLFRRFHRGTEAKKKKPEGTGLGLLIVKRIVERHGGEVWAESEAGRGATFHLRLPAAPAQDPMNTSLNSGSPAELPAARA